MQKKLKLAIGAAVVVVLGGLVRIPLSGQASGGSGCAGEFEAAPLASLESNAGTLRAKAAELRKAERQNVARVLAAGAGRGGFDGVDESQLRLTQRSQGEGFTKVAVEQRVNGVPVLGARARVALNADGEALAIESILARDLKLETKPAIEKKAAAEKAIAHVACAECVPGASPARLFVLPESEKPRLAWRIQPRVGRGEVESQPWVFLDAHSGEVIRTCPAADPACAR